MHHYYSQKLSGERLRLCYEIAPPRTKRYLDAELEFVLSKIIHNDLILELGCGYGRVIQKLAPKAKTIIGIDTSRDSLHLAQKSIGSSCSCYFVEMNAVVLGFLDCQFDVVVCIQNGISAFKVDQRKLITEAIRVTRSGGIVFFSSYSERFWEDRLEWFQIQSEYGLIGEIDNDASGDGVIVCKDGFKATTVDPDCFMSLTSNLDIIPQISEVDGSSIFCEINVCNQR